jgi:hypothetical protein
MAAGWQWFESNLVFQWIAQHITGSNQQLSSGLCIKMKGKRRK